MELVSLSLLSLLFLGFWLGSGAPASGPLFLSGQAADSILRRHKRHNTGLFEEFLQGNLERECIEELCDLEEARETFENDEKTMEFWAGYVDGNQCKPNPCLNQGLCKDHLGSYTCTCLSGFTGRNCEIIIAKRCDVDNGDCMHFCMSMGTFGAKCSCATGYILMDDGVNCKPEDEFPCGRTALSEVSAVSTRFLFDGENTSLQNPTSLTDDTPITTPIPLTTASTTESFPATAHSEENQSRKKLPFWVLSGPHVADRPHKRIVGGKEVTPGEIPWQVALVIHATGNVFCGGSILSRSWVITAAHCLVEIHSSFFVRVGEHNINLDEGTEQDYDVLEKHIHPRYNTSMERQKEKMPIANKKIRRPIRIQGLVIDCPRGLNNSCALAPVPLYTFTIRKHWSSRFSMKTWGKKSGLLIPTFLFFFVMAELC